MMELAEILSLVRARTKSLGVGSKSHYLRSLAGCLDGGACPTHLLGISDKVDWAKELSASANSLVYHNSDMAVTDTDFDLVSAKDLNDLLQDSLARDMPNGAAGIFEHVTTSTRRDRDRDVLETGGARVDTKGPLLLHHFPFQPVGRLVSVVKHTKTRLTERSAVIDDPKGIGADTMHYVRFGAFRISHGFLPDFETMALLDEKDPYGGFHIKGFDILERSLVTIPSNVDAEILAWSRAGDGTKLHTPFFKEMGLAAWRSRPAASPGVDIDKNGQVVHPACSCSKAKPASVVIDDPRKLVGNDTLRWNKSLSESFDVAGEEFEPSDALYGLVKKFLGCEMKHVHHGRESIPAFRMGSFLTSLRETFSKAEVVDTRNLTSGNREMPPVYEVIQLNSTKSDEFLVDGVEFRQFEGRNSIVMIYEPRWYGLSLNWFAVRGKHEIHQQQLDAAWEAAKGRNNFIKGEALSLSGEFLPRTAETWTDVFLEPENATATQRAVRILNEKGSAAANRGMIFMGDPGTGKTLSCRVIRNEAKATFIWISSRDLYYMGSFGGIQAAFDLAKECSPAVMVFEDIDNWLTSQAIDLLKTEMDGIGRSAGVMTVLTTNFPQRLPEALIDRPGRFHDVLKFDLPSEEVRTTMLAKWLPELEADARSVVAKATDGMSGAHIYELAHFARTIQEQDELPLGEAVTKALEKVRQQRELINDAQSSGSRYSPHRAISRALLAKSMAPVLVNIENVAKAFSPLATVRALHELEAEVQNVDEKLLIALERSLDRNLVLVRDQRTRLVLRAS